jgi:nucleoside-diphosphate-sugar epimerase
VKELSQIDLRRLFAVAGRSVVVTGGAGGIGFAVADILSDQGACVTLLDRDQAKIESAVTRGFYEPPYRLMPGILAFTRQISPFSLSVM